MKVAIFDFDGTIYKHETFTLFMNHLKQAYPKRYRKFFTRILPIYLGYKARVVPEKKMKHLMMYHYAQAINDLSSDAQHEFFEDIFKQMEGQFHEEVLQRIQSHRAAGFHTMIVSGAFTILLDIFKELYGIDSVIGTNLPGKNEPLDHIHAENKTTAIFAYSDSSTIDWEESFAYGDSIEDRNILELVGNPVAVYPDHALAALAQKNKWNILS